MATGFDSLTDHCPKTERNGGTVRIQSSPHQLSYLTLSCWPSRSRYDSTDKLRSQFQIPMRCVIESVP